jgi:hypothetical protein
MRTTKSDATGPTTPATGLRTIYCPNCYLSTRAGVERCLHCGKLLANGGGPAKASPEARGAKSPASA